MTDSTADWIVLAATDWTTVISSIGAALVVVIGALAGWTIKIMFARSNVRKNDREEEEKLREKGRVEERKERKDTISEYRELTESLRLDIAQHRNTVHDLRNDNQVLKTENAVFRYRLDVCEWDREDMRAQMDEMSAAMKAAGIELQVHRQRRPPPIPPGDAIVEPHGPHGPPGDGEATAE